MSDEHGEETIEPEAVAEESAIEEVSDATLDEFASGGQYSSGHEPSQLNRPLGGGS